MLRRQRGAFTLIELLVVISIIVLLMALLLPALSRAKESGRRTVCMANQHQISIAFQGYGADNDDALPPSHDGQSPSVTWQIAMGGPIGSGKHQVLDRKTGRYWTGQGFLYGYDYVSDPELVYCPSQRFDLFTYPIGWEGGCVADTPCFGETRVTGYQYRLYSQVHDVGYITPEEVERLRKTRLSDPSMAVFADIFHPGGSIFFWGPPGFPADTVWPHIQGPAGLNVTFTDGHVEWISRPRMTEWGAVSMQVVGNSGGYTAMFWEWLEGSHNRLEEFYYLP